MKNRSATLSLVEKAAVKWWEGARPANWDETFHFQHPTVNTMGTHESDLAKAVAAMVKARKSK